MEKLDSVNVFIFSVLKFKKWNPSLAPGCALSCLKRSDYLLKVCKGGLEGLAHQLITKQQRDAVLFFSVGGEKKKKSVTSKSVLARFVTIFSPSIVVSDRASDLWWLLHPALWVKLFITRCWRNLIMLNLDCVSLKDTCAVHTVVLCHPGDHTLLFCFSDRGSRTE